MPLYALSLEVPLGGATKCRQEEFKAWSAPILELHAVSGGCWRRLPTASVANSKSDSVAE